MNSSQLRMPNRDHDNVRATLHVPSWRWLPLAGVSGAVPSGIRVLAICISRRAEGACTHAHAHAYTDMHAPVACQNRYAAEKNYTVLPTGCQGRAHHTPHWCTVKPAY